MNTQLDLIIRNARLRGGENHLIDIGITGNKIACIEPKIRSTGKSEINADGGMVTESFVNPHLHLCKVWTLGLMDGTTLDAYQGSGMSNAASAIEMAADVKNLYGFEDIVIRARRATTLAAIHGNLHIRAFADVDSISKLDAVRALLKVKEEFKGIVTLQVVAFPQDGIIKNAGTAALMEDAMALGADVVGGIPWIEFSDSDSQKHINICFDLAKKYDKDISMLLDDAGDAGLRTLEMMALESIKREWHGRCIAHHCRAMALYPGPYIHRLLALLKTAKISVVSDPHTGPLHANVKELLLQEVTVALGQDDISDAYYPFGRNNMLEVAFLASHLLWMTKKEEIESLFEMITKYASLAMNISNHKIAIGSTADIVIMEDRNIIECIRNHSHPLHVISNGLKLDTKALKNNL